MIGEYPQLTMHPHCPPNYQDHLLVGITILVDQEDDRVEIPGFWIFFVIGYTLIYYKKILDYGRNKRPIKIFRYNDMIPERIMFL